MNLLIQSVNSVAQAGVGSVIVYILLKYTKMTSKIRVCLDMYKNLEIKKSLCTTLCLSYILVAIFFPVR